MHVFRDSLIRIRKTLKILNVEIINITFYLDSYPKNQQIYYISFDYSRKNDENEKHNVIYRN